MGQTTLPGFQTPRLHLREIRIQDIEAYSHHFIDYEVIRHLSAGVPWPYPKHGVELYLRNHIFPQLGKTLWMWGIFLKSDPKNLVGAIELFQQGRPEHRGFWLGRRFWRQGLMTEALIPITDYAFEEIGFEKLVFSNAVGNLRSRRIKEKMGAKLKDIQKGQFVDPALTRREIWEITHAEWLSHRPQLLASLPFHFPNPTEIFAPSPSK